MLKNTRKEDWRVSTTLNYLLLYIQRWIPFNAWYSCVIDGKKDADAISYFKVETNNKLYEVIKQYLKHDKKDFYGIEFCYHLSCLDKLLSKNDFPNIDERIVFGEVELKPNTQKDATDKKDGLSYKVERNPVGKPNKSVQVIVQDLKTRKIKHSICIPRHDLVLLKSKFAEGKVLRAEQKIILQLFKKVEPIITVDVKDVKDGKLTIFDSKFTSNLDYLCSSIVDVLYGLRCKAVHGEIDVSKDVLEIYEHAYFMLESIIRKLF